MKIEGCIIIVDDEEDLSFSLKLFLGNYFTRVITENNPFHIPRLLRQHNPDVVMLDMNFTRGKTDGSEGLHWLQKTKELAPDVAVLMITAYSDVNVAVNALKHGALDFLEKPWRNEKLLATVKSALTLRKSQSENNKLVDKNSLLNKSMDEPFAHIIGESPQMAQVYRMMDKVAKTDAHVLIMGENGTGKELIARGIHRKSNRNKETFISVDLGAVQESLFESELFGHKKGAFTDAHEDRIGRFEAAHGGTIFLDEIGNLSIAMQAKLLQVLQNKLIYKVGDTKPIEINARVICATNMPLYEMVEEKTFRQDLLYRINTIEINAPRLCERKGDISILASHFLDQLKKKYRREELEVSPESLLVMEEYAWPGNVRELRHVMERAVILSDGDKIEPEFFLVQRHTNSNKLDTLNLEELEKKSILKALEINRGNISKASKDLGITRAALYRRLEKYNIDHNEDFN